MLEQAVQMASRLTEPYPRGVVILALSGLAWIAVAVTFQAF
jgi:hypothetical protein